MRRSWFLACVLTGLVVPALLHAQPAEWGEVPRQQLEMDTYPADANAAAVILSDVGSVHFDARARIVYERHRRIKILAEGGYDWGTVELAYLAEDRMQRVLDIDGQTFSLSDDGAVERYELDGDDVFEEDVNGVYRRKRFTLPALEPGAVIEYRYEMRSESPLLMPEWLFQTDEPTLWSEFEVEIPNQFHFVHIMHGAPDFHIEEHSEVLGPDGKSQKYRWVMTDVPALREEPFVTTLKNHQARLALQLKSYQFRGHTKQFMSSWDNLAEELLDRSDFGGQLDSGGDVRTRAELLVRDLQDPVAKIKAIYDYVRTKVEWNGVQGFIPGRAVDDVLEAQSGSHPEITLLLVALLRNVGVEAHPVLLSTRDHGKMQPVYPFLSQFNTTVVYVEVADRAYLLDATDPMRPYDLLPVRALNGAGWMVTEEGGRWLRISPNPYERRVSVVGQLSANGTVEAEVQVIDSDYSALQRRRLFQEHGAQAFIRDVILEDLNDVDIQSHEIQNEAPEDPLVSRVTMRAPGYAQRAERFLYVNPALLERRRENTLRAPSRSFPVEFAYPRDITFILSLQLPEGYVVDAVPPNVQVQLPEKSGYFQRAIDVANRRLTLQARLLIVETTFEPEAYGALRDFYQRIIAAQAEHIVLKRTNETETADDVSAGGTEQ
jgi:transglutaminase-like putative cysteine protease